MLHACESWELTVCIWRDKPCSEASVKHRTMCLAKSCWRICGVSSLNHQLGSACSLVYAAICPEVSEESALSDTFNFGVTVQSTTTTQQTDEDERTRQCHGREFTHRCLQNTRCSHSMHMIIHFSHFFLSLILLLFCPKV